MAKYTERLLNGMRMVILGTNQNLIEELKVESIEHTLPQGKLKIQPNLLTERNMVNFTLSDLMEH